MGRIAGNSTGRLEGQGMYKDGIYTSIKKTADVRGYLVHWKLDESRAASVTGPAKEVSNADGAKRSHLHE